MANTTSATQEPQRTGRLAPVKVEATARRHQALAQKLLPTPVSTRMRSMDPLSGFDRIFDLSQIREHMHGQRQLLAKLLAAKF